MKFIPSLALAVALAIGCHDATAQTATTKPVGFLNVQGVLHENGVPVNGFYDWCFWVYDAPMGGRLLAHDTNMNNSVQVSNGVANVLLNIGDLAALNLSPTQEVYLELDVRPSGSADEFTHLLPRQRVTPSMFATSAVRAEEARRLIEPLSPDLLPTSIPGLSFTGAPTFGARSGAPFTVMSSAVVAGLDADLLDGLDSSAFWKLAGNAGTTAGIDFLGTTDNQPLELKVNNQRALRLEPTATSPNVIAGSAVNVISATAGSSILGGDLHRIDASAHAVIAGGYTNAIQTGAAQSTIGGGANNVIGAGSERATIAGGYSNTLAKAATTIGGGEMNSIASGHGTIGGGHENAIWDASDDSTIGGGVLNRVDQGAQFATVSGGNSNVVGRASSVIAGGQYNLVGAFGANIGGGIGNQVQNEATGSVIAGGVGNAVQSAVTNGVIAGGFGNVIHTNAHYSSVGGGRGNHIGSGVPFATVPGGREAKAISYGQVVHASGGFGSQEGTAQESFYVLRGTSTDANSAELFLDGLAERIHVPAGATWTYDVLIAARSDSPGSAGFHIRGTIGYNPVGALVQIGTPVIDQFGGGASVTAQVVADNVNKALTVQVRWGLLGSNTTRWVATVRTAEVMFPTN